MRHGVSKGVCLLLEDRDWPSVLLRNEFLSREVDVVPRSLRLVGVWVAVEANDVLLLLDKVVVQIRDGRSASSQRRVVGEGRVGGDRLAVRVRVINDGILVRADKLLGRVFRSGGWRG